MTALATHQWAAICLIPAYLVGVGVAWLLDLIQHNRRQHHD